MSRGSFVLVSANFDPSKPAHVHTHYHGNDTTAAADVQGCLRMRHVQGDDPQVVFVLPEGEREWSNVKSQAQTTLDALAAAAITNVGLTTVSAFSGGYRALWYAMQADATGAGVRCNRLELLDCMYVATAKSGSPAKNMDESSRAGR